ncbi:MAG: NADH-quinone oxidoreductase subunit J [Magnetovibrio sp.]|nr:NADH-quinone oxidoreductase subunit J [Magnetovibrio sp.]
MEAIFFLTFAALAVASALGVVLLRNPVHCAISLMVCFIQVAAIFVLLRSPFLAVVQIFVYVGAIMVLFLFVIMMLDIRTAVLERFLPGWEGVPILGVLTVLGLQMLIMLLTSDRLLHPPADVGTALDGTVAELGKALFLDYLLPFEVVSVVLLVAFVGAIILAKRERKE